MAEMKDHFTKVSRLMSGDISTLMPLSCKSCCTASNVSRGTIVFFVCSVNQAEYLSHLCDFSFAGNKSYDVDATVQYRDAGNQPLDAGTGSVNVENGNDYRILLCGVPLINSVMESTE